MTLQSESNTATFCRNALLAFVGCKIEWILTYDFFSHVNKLDIFLMVRVGKFLLPFLATYKSWLPWLLAVCIFCFQRLWTFLSMNPASQVRRLPALNLQRLSQQLPMETSLQGATLLSWEHWSDVEKQR